MLSAFSRLFQLSRIDVPTWLWKMAHLWMYPVKLVIFFIAMSNYQRVFCQVTRVANPQKDRKKFVRIPPIWWWKFGDFGAFPIFFLGKNARPWPAAMLAAGCCLLAAGSEVSHSPLDPTLLATASADRIELLLRGVLGPCDWKLRS